MIADRVKELSTSTGTGALTLSGAVTAYESFNTTFGIGPSFDYCIESVDDTTGMPSGSWEVGRGHLSGATTLVRDTVQQSSNADALVAFGVGTKNVFCTLSAAAINALAPLASPVFTGNPTAPTPTAGDNDTSIATTAFVGTAVSNAAVPPATIAPPMDAAAAVGVATKYAREDHIHPSDTSRIAKAGGTMTGPLVIADATASTSSTTGALTVAGGVGVEGAVNTGGDLTIAKTWPVLFLDKAASGQANAIYGKMNGSSRWGMQLGNETAEGGGNAGSDFQLHAFDNASGYIGPYLTIFRATGNIVAPAAVVIGSPTGGAKGNGTLNAVSVYDDNVLLTCFGTQYAARGTVDLAQWDAVSPTGKHTLAHKFVDMLKGFDPRDPRQYIKRMMADEALPGMPTMDEWRHGEASLGELHNRLWLATELLASAFVGLHNDYERRLAKLMKRVDALEKRT